MQINIPLYKPFERNLQWYSFRYGKKFKWINGLHPQQLGLTTFIDQFVDKQTSADASIDGSANIHTKDICTLQQEMNKPSSKLLSLNKIFYEIEKEYGRKTAKEFLKGEWNGSFYLHDAVSSSQIPYCYAYDLTDLATKGLYFHEKFNYQPPQHFDTWIDFVGEFISFAANRSSGAVGIPNFLVWSYYFWKKDIESGYYTISKEKYRDQQTQRILYKLNQKWIRILQCSFTNFSIFDRLYLTELFGGMVYPDGSFVVDQIEDIIEFQKSFLKIRNKILQVNQMTFPVTSYCLLYKNKKFQDEEFAYFCIENEMQLNATNWFVSPDVTNLSSCCRLKSDISPFINSIGGTGLQVGSVKVNDINLVRIALETKSWGQYKKLLQKRTILCLQVLDRVRYIIQRNIEKGLLPNYSYNLIDINTQYNTVGIGGMFETVEYFGGIDYDQFGNCYYNQKGIQIAEEIMEVIKQQIKSFLQLYNKKYMVNIENSPGEKSLATMKEKDRLLFGSQVKDQQNPLYSNQWISLSQKCTLQEKIRVSSLLDNLCDGGQITHINIDAPFVNTQQAWDMLNYIAKNGVIYFAFNQKTYTCQSNHGFTSPLCPICGEKPIDAWTRTVGFNTPVSSYSSERKTEFSQRYWFNFSE